MALLIESSQQESVVIKADSVPDAGTSRNALIGKENVQCAPGGGSSAQ
jgi:hypothetical protein